MMRILNFGSLNLDKVYPVAHFVSAGETVSAARMERFCGGKGMNQSIALARAGAKVYHAGAIGADGGMLLDALVAAGVDCRYVQKLADESGHAIIQRTPDGQNCILVCPGTNGCMTEDFFDRVLADFSAGDLLLVQNEINLVDMLLRKAKQRGMRIAMNASPVSEAMLTYPLELVDCFLVNEIEGKCLSGCRADAYARILAALAARYPNAEIVLTVGKDGVLYQKGTTVHRHGIYTVPVKDTTAAGDTFCGYFLAATANGMPAEKALETASMASAICVSREGAAPSIPTMDEVKAFAENRERKN